MSTVAFDIPHSLGKAEAKRRVIAGLPTMAQHIPLGGAISSSTWTDDRLELVIALMGQKVAAQLDVGDAAITGTVAVPAMLSGFFSGQIGDFIKVSADKMLSKA
jgi:hypothetical protein